jgi:hypothetical protein
MIVASGLTLRIAAIATLSSWPYSCADGAGGQNPLKFGSFHTSRATGFPFKCDATALTYRENASS